MFEGRMCRRWGQRWWFACVTSQSAALRVLVARRLFFLIIKPHSDHDRSALFNATQRQRCFSCNICGKGAQSLKVGSRLAPSVCGAVFFSFSVCLSLQMHVKGSVSEVEAEDGWLRRRRQKEGEEEEVSVADIKKTTLTESVRRALHLFISTMWVFERLCNLTLQDAGSYTFQCGR